MRKGFDIQLLFWEQLGDDPKNDLLDALWGVYETATKTIVYKNTLYCAVCAGANGRHDKDCPLERVRKLCEGHNVD